MNVGKTIRRLREFRNLTQEYMAVRLNIGSTAYGNIERNDTKRLTIERLMQIAEVLDVHFTEFFNEQPPELRQLKKGLPEKDLQDLLAYFRQDKLLMKEMVISLRDSAQKLDHMLNEHLRIMQAMLKPLAKETTRRAKASDA